MKNGIPSIYWTFRMVWTFAHFLIVAAAAAALLTWALTNHNAERAFEPAKDNVLELQQRVSNIIPWPWATDGDGGGDGSDSSSSSDNGSSSGSGQEYQVIGNVNVRNAPNSKAKKVDSLSDGSWVTLDCVTEGESVDPGPYQSQLSEYQGKDYGATSKWDHIPGVGYVSDAYIATSNAAGLPAC